MSREANRSGFEEDADPTIENRAATERYKVWKKNVPLLYDVMMTQGLEWPSLTVQWFPDKLSPPGKDYSYQRVILGTHTSDGEQNYLMIAEVRLPSEEMEIDAKKWVGDPDDVKDKADKGEKDKADSKEKEGYGAGNGKFEMVQQINHQGEVNRARYMPQNPNLIATKSPTADVMVFDKTKHGSKPSKVGVCSPDIRLRGHSKEGFGMAWNPHREGWLVSGSDDSVVCVWDINASPLTGGAQSSTAPVVQANRLYRGHTDVVEDVAWHGHHPYLLGSVGDDKYVMIWDTRAHDGGGGSPVAKTIAHDGEVNCIAFNPFRESVFITGGADARVCVWDYRCLSQPVHALTQGFQSTHAAQLLNISFSPFSETVFGSCGADKRVAIWDLSRIGMSQSVQDAKEGPPELLFVHGGHTDKIEDFSWNPSVEWMIASVSDDNTLHIWQPSESVYADEEGGVGPFSDPTVLPVVASAQSLSKNDSIPSASAVVSADVGVAR